MPDEQTKTVEGSYEAVAWEWDEFNALQMNSSLAWNTVLWGQGTKIVCEFVIDKCSLTSPVILQAKLTVPWQCHSGGRRHGMWVALLNTSFGARLPGFDLDSVILKNLHNLSVPPFPHLWGRVKNSKCHLIVSWDTWNCAWHMASTW